LHQKGDERARYRNVHGRGGGRNNTSHRHTPADTLVIANKTVTSIDNNPTQMIIDNIISSTDTNDEIIAFSDKAPEVPQKSSRIPNPSLAKNSFRTVGKTVISIAAAEDIPSVVFKYPMPALTVLNASPTALPTIGIKLAAANFTLRKDTESLLDASMV
jgi:hypothetical protein